VCVHLQWLRTDGECRSAYFCIRGTAWAVNGPHLLECVYQLLADFPMRIVDGAKGFGYFNEIIILTESQHGSPWDTLRVKSFKHLFIFLWLKGAIREGWTVTSWIACWCFHPLRPFVASLAPPLAYEGTPHCHHATMAEAPQSKTTYRNFE